MKLLFFVLLSVSCFVGACTSSRNVIVEYDQNKMKAEMYSKNTTVVFLVDGLTFSVFKNLLDKNRLPKISHFFAQSGGASLLQMRSIFPSLTFPNITSLLTLSPVDQHPIYGNRITEYDNYYQKQEIINFENPAYIQHLNTMLKPQTIFTQLQEKNKGSVSFSYSFHAGTSANIKLNFKAGMQYANQDYKALDNDTLEGLNSLLSKIPANQWPQFVFVHLVGVDALSHQYGPNSKSVSDYIVRLDRLLSDVFKTIQKKESDHITTTLLMTDHGLTTIKKTIALEKIVTELTPHSMTIPLILNETRMASLLFSKSWTDADKLKFYRELIRVTGISSVAYRQKNSLEILFPNTSVSMKYIEKPGCANYSYFLEYKGTHACPQALDQNYKLLDYKFAFESFSSYFHVADRPDAVLLADNNVGFNANYVGAHGGLSEEEMMTPLMIRNGHIVAQTPNNLPIYQILQFVLTSN